MPDELTLERSKEFKGAEVLSGSVDLAVDREEIFDFFSDANNLALITPKWLHFRVLDAPERELRSGDEINYRLRVRGIPIRWRSRIEDFNRPESFVDTQLIGPYKLWHHTHTFESVEGGTRCFDRVVFRSPFAFITHPLFVRRDVKAIFRHRLEVLRNQFGTIEG